MNEFCRLHGFADTHMGRLLLAPNDMDDNYTSVNDCGKFLREMNGNVLVGSEKLLDLMRQQERTGKIPAGGRKILRLQIRRGNFPMWKMTRQLYLGKTEHIQFV